ncbi:MAG TPA: hypothetical protein DCQ31_00470 [Bacteroidales bacterium]|nr:hypothetical protein [Bacteroidales bacterium]
MRNINLVILGFITTLFLSCEAMEISKAEIYGAWEQTGYENETLVLKRVKALSGNEYGFELLENGTFIENKNAGWCGTPPISYTKYEGKWTLVSDSIFNIEVPFWGGDSEFELIIADIKKDELQILLKFDSSKN